MIDDNRVWIGAMDSLIAGAGDPDVPRAGVMRLLSTIGAVEVQDHGATLDIRNTDFPDGYAETLTVDAKTELIAKMTGGVVGKAPSVVVDYDIKRVDRGETSSTLGRRGGRGRARRAASPSCGSGEGGGGGFGRAASRSASSARPMARKTSDTATTQAIPKIASAIAFKVSESPASTRNARRGEQQTEDAEDGRAHRPHIT